MQNSKYKMQNIGMCCAHIFKLFSQKTPQFCILHSAFCISASVRETTIYLIKYQFIVPSARWNSSPIRSRRAFASGSSDAPWVSIH